MSTIDHVATLAGVSKATVSRVINQRGNVHPDTVRAVREAISRARYNAPAPKPERRTTGFHGRNNPAALSAYALLVPEIVGELYSSLLKGFEAAAHEQYHQVIVCNTANNLFKQGDDILQLIHKKVGGVAMVPVASAKTPPSHIQVLEEAGIPVVLLHRDVESVDAPLIALPLEDVGYRAGKALLDCGHRRIAFFAPMQSTSADMHRRGLMRALAEAGLDLADEVTCRCPGCIPLSLPILGSYVDQAVARMWSLPEDRRPTGIYVTFDTIAQIVFMSLIGHGLRMPADVSLMSFGGSQRTSAITGRLSSIVVDELAIGQLAAELLMKERSERGSREAGSRLLHNAALSFVQGETLGPAPAVAEPATVGAG